jgi:hypothetical protein
VKGLLIRSFLAALLIAPLATLVVDISRMRAITEYQPGISEAEMKAYDNRTVAELEAFLQSRRARLTRYQSLREVMRYSYFWKGLARGSVAPCIAVFLGCVIVGGIERRHALSAKMNAR